MRTNTVVEVDGKFFHPEEFAAPYGWARTTGERVTVEGQEGLWCEVTNDQEPFRFIIIPPKSFHLGPDALITRGFKNEVINGSRSLPIGLLLYGTDAEVKAEMKEKGLPSCTRKNLVTDFRRFYYGDDEPPAAYDKHYHCYGCEHSGHLSFCEECPVH